MSRMTRREQTESTSGVRAPFATIHDRSEALSEKRFTPLSLVNSELTLTCPGEAHPISRSVHLARLSSGYQGCQDCRWNQSASSTHGRHHGRTLVTPDGIRGVYLNDLDRTRAADWGAAFASFLWDDQPRVGLQTPARSVELVTSVPALSDPNIAIPKLVTPPTRRGPVVVIGFDERTSSPDIIMGVAIGLRRMGCHVIDLGQTSQPCFHFAVHHLDAVGGVFVTGSGCDPAWTGFHFAGRNSTPWLHADQLTQLERRAATEVARPTRTAGTQRAFHADVPYQTGLWKLFHALRPLQVVCGTATRQLPRVLDALFARLPCQLSLEPLPVRRRNLNDPQDVDVRRVAGRVLAGRHHLGLIVDDDGERCAFVTNDGQLVTAGELARLLVLLEMHEHRATRAVVDETLYPEVTGWLASVGTACQVEPSSLADLPAAVIQHNAALGITADHRVWFGGPYPASNAILTLARVLQALSLSDTPMSEVIRRAA